MTTDNIPEKSFQIYCITNDINNKKYVGQTSHSFEKRWKKHKYDALVEGRGSALHVAIRKYGVESFRVSLLEENIVSQLQADQREVHWIDLLNSVKFGYNRTTGGNTQHVVLLSDETKQQMSRSKLGKLNTTRRANTLEEDRPIVDLFKSGVSRSQIASQLNISSAKVQKALARWKARVDPDLNVGKENHYENSGKALRLRAIEAIKSIVDDLLSGMSYKDAAAKHNVDYGRIKGIVHKVRKRPSDFNVPADHPLLINRNHSAKESTNDRDEVIIRFFNEGKSRRQICDELNLEYAAVKHAIVRNQRMHAPEHTVR